MLALTRRGLRAVLLATILIGGLAGLVIRPVSAASVAGTMSSSASVPAATTASPPPVGTLNPLPYTFPDGSGGSLLKPLGVSAAQGTVYVSNTEHNVVSSLAGGATTTVAGNLEATGESGDGGPAAAAGLNGPAGLAEDTSGDLYIADTGDNVIRKVDRETGVISRFAGSGVAGNGGLDAPATKAQLDGPQGVAVDASGDVFIADTYNNRVDEVLANDLIEPFAGNGHPGYKGDGHQAKGAELNDPTGVAVDSAGNVYIADAANNVVRRVDASTGVISTVAGSVAADQASDGLGGFSGDGGPATLAQLHTPEGVALDPAGDLFIADTANNAIREVTTDGTIFTVVNAAGTGDTAPPAGGETAGPATASGLKGPCAVAVDASAATVYIADTANNEVAAVTGLAQNGHAPGPVAPQ